MNSIVRHLAKRLTITGSSSHLCKSVACNSQALPFVAVDSRRGLNTKSDPLDAIIQKSIEYERKSLGLDFHQTRVREELTKQPPRIEIESLREMLYLSKNDHDLDLFANALIAYHYEEKERRMKIVNKTEGDKNTSFVFITKFFNLLLLLKKTDKAMEYYNNKIYSPFFNSHMVLQILYEMLMQEKRYDDLVAVFKNHWPRYMPPNRGQYRNTPRMPQSHVEMFTSALLKQNSVDALANFSDFYMKLKNNGGEFGVAEATRLAYLALLKNNPNIASQLVTNNLFRGNAVLYHNMKAIILRKMNRNEDAIKQLRFIFNKEIPTFHFTFKCFRENPEETTLEFRMQVDLLFKKTLLESRFTQLDLGDMVELELNELTDMLDESRSREEPKRTPNHIKNAARDHADDNDHVHEDGHSEDKQYAKRKNV